MRNLYAAILLFIFCAVAPSYADSDGFGLLIKQNEQQVRMNQYQVIKQLNEQKINLIKQLNNVDVQTDFVQQNQSSTTQTNVNKNK